MKMTAELFLFDLDIFYANFLESLKSSTMDLYDILDSHISKYNEFGKKIVTRDIYPEFVSDGLGYFVLDKYLDQNLTFSTYS